MTMAGMIEYFEHRGFNAEKTYRRLPAGNGGYYTFRIERDGHAVTSTFTYPEYKTQTERHTEQLQFCRGLVDQWYSTVDNHISQGKFEIKTTNPYGDYRTQRDMYNFLNKEFHMKGKRTGISAVGTLQNAAHRNNKGLLKIDDCTVPVQVNTIRQAPGDPIEIECEVLSVDTDTAYDAYCQADVNLTKQIAKRMLNSVYGAHGQFGPQIKDVIFNPPATIILWKDGTKTVVKAEGEDYDPEKGLAMAIAKKTLGNNYSYYNTFKKWLKKAPQQPTMEHSTRTLIGKVCSFEDSPDGLYARVGLNSMVEATKLKQAIEKGQLTSFEIVADGDV